MECQLSLYAFPVSPPSIESADLFTRLKVEQTGLSQICLLARISIESARPASKSVRKFESFILSFLSVDTPRADRNGVAEADLIS